MKLDMHILPVLGERSPPVRRRGLKPVVPRAVVVGFIVASRAEAWIETVRQPFTFTTCVRVASRAEAWIETG